MLQLYHTYSILHMLTNFLWIKALEINCPSLKLKENYPLTFGNYSSDAVVDKEVEEVYDYEPEKGGVVYSYVEIEK